LKHPLSSQTVHLRLAGMAIQGRLSWLRRPLDPEVREDLRGLPGPLGLLRRQGMLSDVCAGLELERDTVAPDYIDWCDPAIRGWP
jgi:hypothetical protein